MLFQQKRVRLRRVEFHDIRETFHQYCSAIMHHIVQRRDCSSTYGHISQKASGPVCSRTFKLASDGLVPRRVTTEESPLLYVFVFFGLCVLISIYDNELMRK
jgi:hypothetical protein